MAQTPKRMYRSGEAAKMIGIAHSTLRKWVQEGRIEPSGNTLGGNYMWSLEKINEIRHSMGLEPIAEPA